MSDIRKRTGKNGVTYQLRFADQGSESGYSYKTFETMKQARAFREDGSAAPSSGPRGSIKTVNEAIQKWLDVCEHEGRDGRDAISKATCEVYKSRAKIMHAYAWEKDLRELRGPDVVAFRSWLLKHYTRDQSQKVLSSFHSVMLEMVSQGALATDPASKVTVQQSRYREPVQIPSVEEVRALLTAADELANEKDQRIAPAWARYRAMIYLAADTGMRPQEYLVMPTSNLLERGVRVTQALDRSNQIGPPKSRAGRRFIPVRAETLAIVRACTKGEDDGFLFPGEMGQHLSYTNFRRRCWLTLMERAGLVDEEKKHGKTTAVPRYTPYSLRHFFASMLIAANKDLKTIQEYMGHEDAAMTLNVYGHLIRMKRAEETAEAPGVVSGVLASRCGNSVADIS